MKDLLSKVSVWKLKQAYKAQEKVFCTPSQFNLEALKRLERAYDMLTKDTSYAITFIKGNLTKPSSFEVMSMNATYTVIPSQHSCTCPDAERSPICKHQLAVNLLISAAKMKE